LTKVRDLGCLTSCQCLCAFFMHLDGDLDMYLLNHGAF
jgi:hypothetical protein